MSDGAHPEPRGVGVARVPLPGLWAAVLLAQLGVVASVDLGAARLAYGWFAASTGLVAAIDIYERRIPNRLLSSTWTVGLILLAVAAVVDDRGQELWVGVLGGIGYSFLLLAAGRLPGGEIGVGDVKLAFPVGLFVGYVDLAAVVAAVVGAFALTVAAGGVMVVVGLSKRTDTIPFAPQMVLAAWAAIAATQLGLL